MSSLTPIDNKRRQVKRCVISLLSLAITLSTAAEAGPREQAKRIHDRIAGVPPSEAVLNDMASDITSGDPIAAAYTAMENKNFYDVTLKNMVAPWTNEAQSLFVPLNDYTATVVGMIRDEDVLGIDFREVLYGNHLYVGKSSLGAPAYSLANNAHYEFLETQRVSLKDDLVHTTQSLPAEATAGVMTTRAAAKAFFSGGTNRAMFRFTLMNHLCNDLEQVKDITRAPDRIRQDVSRSPGGDSRIFLNNCVGCHSGMDPMAQAFAYYEYEYDMDADPDGENGALVYNTAGMTDPDTGTRVQGKYHINSTTFQYGYVTPDDHWDNYWREGQNSLLGWDKGLTGSGQGAKSMGMELAHSEAFAQCQVKNVFRTVCLRSPIDSADRDQIGAMVSSFKASGYKMKRVFAESAAYCMGE